MVSELETLFVVTSTEAADKLMATAEAVAVTTEATNNTGSQPTVSASVACSF